MKACTLGICMAVLVATAGCAPAGYYFTRPPSETLVLGKTTYEEVIRQVGEPVRAGTITQNGQPLKTISYVYSCAGFSCRFGDRPAEWGVRQSMLQSRAMHFFFLDDVLVGYRYTSTLSDDPTNFDDTKAYQLKKGQTTRSQVIELLGNPSGMYIYPMISSKTDTALVYFYSGVKLENHFLWLTAKPTLKLLIVSFDSQDLVTGVEFGTGGEK